MYICTYVHIYFTYRCEHIFPSSIKKKFSSVQKAGWTGVDDRLFCSNNVQFQISFRIKVFKFRSDLDLFSTKYINRVICVCTNYFSFFFIHYQIFFSFAFFFEFVVYQWPKFCTVQIFFRTVIYSVLNKSLTYNFFFCTKNPVLLNSKWNLKRITVQRNIRYLIQKKNQYEKWLRYCSNLSNFQKKKKKFVKKNLDIFSNFFLLGICETFNC